MHRAVVCKPTGMRVAECFSRYIVKPRMYQPGFAVYITLGDFSELHMNKISAVMHRSKYTKSAHPVFAIDGIPASSWIKGIVYNHLGEDTTDGLVAGAGLVD